MGRFSDTKNKNEPSPRAMTARFFAHAELCREIATQCRDEEIAGKLEQLAKECLRAARTAGDPARAH